MAQTNTSCIVNATVKTCLRLYFDVYDDNDDDDDDDDDDDNNNNNNNNTTTISKAP